MSIGTDAETKKKIIAEYATAEGDTGSPEVQVALLSFRISHLTEHLKQQEATTTTAVVASCCSSASAVACSTTCRRPTSSATARSSSASACVADTPGAVPRHGEPLLLVCGLLR